MENVLFDGLFDSTDLQRDFAQLPDGRIFCYQDIIDLSARYANVLVDWGIKPGDRVAAQVPKSIEAVVLYLASVRAGGVFLPLNTAYTASEIEYFLGDATPHVFICDPVNYHDYANFCQNSEIRLETLGVWAGRK